MINKRNVPLVHLFGIIAIMMIIGITMAACKKQPAGTPGNTNTDSGVFLAYVPVEAAIFVDIQDVATDMPPHTVKSPAGHDITMVPAEALFEAIGYSTAWLPKEQRLEIYESSGENLAFVFLIGHPVAWFQIYAAEIDERLNGEEPLLSPAALINGKVFIPLHFITDRIGYWWDSSVDSNNIYLFSPAYREMRMGEGKGVSQPLDEIEMNWLLNTRTENWHSMGNGEKETIIFFIVRWWDVVDGYITPDFDEMLMFADLDHQMKINLKNGVDEGIFQTACKIYNIDISKYFRS
ncbi:MAG: copper amine oxidase N-terminal domain-containing protein [Treponema sp.]|nr:copper amine oxidase N-terminal domain-containing protein [Treponema sp.]